MMIKSIISHIIDYKTQFLVKKNIDNLKVNIIDVGTVSISDTPHFSYVNGDKQIYIIIFIIILE